jgi:glucuronosyltransferase
MIFGGCHRYRETAQRLSCIFRDQAITPLEHAVYWTEYVIRYKGAPHLRSVVLDLAWYQYFLLDVIVVLSLAVGSVILIVYITLRAVLGKICGGGRHKEDDKILRKKKRS